MLCVPLPVKHISVVICVSLPGKHIFVVICGNMCVLIPGKHTALVICVPLPRKHISLVLIFWEGVGEHMFLVLYCEPIQQHIPISLLQCTSFRHACHIRILYCYPFYIFYRTSYRKTPLEGVVREKKNQVWLD